MVCLEALTDWLEKACSMNTLEVAHEMVTLATVPTKSATIGPPENNIVLKVQSPTGWRVGVTGA